MTAVTWTGLTSSTRGAEIPTNVTLSSKCPNGRQNGPLSRETDRTVAQLREYGAKHEATFGGFTLVDNIATISFTDDLTSHVSALTSLLQYPSPVVVCPAKLSKKDSDVISLELERRNIQVQRSPGSPLIGVWLGGNQQSVADALLVEFPGILEIQLGWFPYPDMTAATVIPIQSPMCGVVPTKPTSDRLTWRLDVRPLTSTDGASLVGTLRVIGKGHATKVRFPKADPAATLLASITRRGDTKIIAQVPTNSGFLPELNLVRILRKGQRVRFNYIISFDSCDASLGWRLPKGNYDAHFGYGGFASPALPVTVR